jgi:large subunit ribosomal protein L21
MYALVEIKGKQYKAAEGSVLKVDRFDTEPGDQVEFDSVLLVSDEERVQVGQPYLKGVKVQAVVEEHGRDKKILVFKYKKRKNYRRTRGHRQQFSLLRVEKITGV